MPDEASFRLRIVQDYAGESLCSNVGRLRDGAAKDPRGIVPYGTWALTSSPMSKQSVRSTLTTYGEPTLTVIVPVTGEPVQTLSMSDCVPYLTSDKDCTTLFTRRVWLFGLR